MLRAKHQKHQHTNADVVEAMKIAKRSNDKKNTRSLERFVHSRIITPATIRNYFNMKESDHQVNRADEGGGSTGSQVIQALVQPV